MKPLCVKCEIELRITISGVTVVELFQGNKEIYRIWSADLWSCPKCRMEIISGFGDKPLKYHHDGDLKEYVENLKKEGKEQIVYNRQFFGE